MILKADYESRDESFKTKKSSEICFKCGICCVVRGYSCHVSYDSEKFNPRYTFVYDCLGSSDPARNPNIWLCVSCHKCEEVCPYEVSPIKFIEEMKSQAFEMGLAPSLIMSEVENILTTGYAFPISSVTLRLREELHLEPLQMKAIEDLRILSSKTGFIDKMLKAKENHI
ncbi:hypothetical protein KEJ21_01685 [Candidatus Bathyarchaeota archaeon]|nr:hypothetical protein [Candidatus Bathyarchaeota archaeon]MBS7630894.1 hypothetical protein [Candidatus Bathyarchaeota archaeon]